MLIIPDKLKLAKYLDRRNKIQVLDNLFLDQDKAVVCNGHCMIQIEDVSPSCEDFPDIEGLTGTDYIPDRLLVTADTATKVLKNLPKNTNLPILDNVLIEVNSGGNVGFGLTDLYSSIVIRQREEHGEYPDTDSRITKDEPKAKVDVSIKYLKKIVSALNEFLNGCETDRVELALHGPENAVAFRSKKNDITMTALIMPLAENKA